MTLTTAGTPKGRKQEPTFSGQHLLPIQRLPMQPRIFFLNDFVGSMKITIVSIYLTGFENLLMVCYSLSVVKKSILFYFK